MAVLAAGVADRHQCAAPDHGPALGGKKDVGAGAGTANVLRSGRHSNPAVTGHGGDIPIGDDKMIDYSHVDERQRL